MNWAAYFFMALSILFFFGWMRALTRLWETRRELEAGRKNARAFFMALGELGARIQFRKQEPQSRDLADYDFSGLIH